MTPSVLGLTASPAGLDPRAARHAAADEIMALASKMASAHGRMVGHETERGQGDRAPRRESSAAAQDRLGAVQRTDQLRQGRDLARVANAANEEALVQWARNGMVSQLSSITSGYLKVKASDDGRDGAHLRRHLSYFFTEDGAFRMRAQMSADQGAAVARAIDAASDALFEGQKTFTDHELSRGDLDHQNYTRSDHRGSRQADALVSLAEAFLEHGLADDRAAKRYKVLVHVDQAALGGNAHATSELEDGAGISHHSALRLSCDCDIQALLQGDGVPLELGRERRVLSPGLRRALEARDRCCVFPGCTTHRRLDAHHVRHWVRDGGKTEPDNLSLLCRRHHRLPHLCDTPQVANEGSEIAGRRIGWRDTALFFAGVVAAPFAQTVLYRSTPTAWPMWVPNLVLLALIGAVAFVLRWKHVAIGMLVSGLF